MRTAAQFPPVDIAFGFAVNTVKMLQRFCDWRASKNDPLVLGSKKLLTGLTVADSVATACAVIGFSALASSYATTGALAVTGVALAPICLFIYAAVSAGIKTAGVFHSVYDFIKEIGKKEPHNTYGLRIAKRCNEIFNNMAHVAFRVLLAIVAFIAIANPLGLTIAATTVIASAVAITIFGAASLWIKNTLHKKIQERNKVALEQMEIHAPRENLKPEITPGRRPRPVQGPSQGPSQTEGVSPIPDVSPRSSSSLSGSRSGSGSRSRIPTQSQLLTNYNDIQAKPRTDLTWQYQSPYQSIERPFIKADKLKDDIVAVGSDRGMNLTIIPEEQSQDKFRIYKDAERGPKWIADVHCEENLITYQLPHTKTQDQEHRNEIIALLQPMIDNEAEILTLEKGTSKELLFIYETALDLGIKNINIAPEARQKIEKFQHEQLQALEYRLFALKTSPERDLRAPTTPGKLI